MLICVISSYIIDYTIILNYTKLDMHNLISSTRDLTSAWQESCPPLTFQGMIGEDEYIHSVCPA